MIFSTCVAIANYAIYMSTIDYMVASYGIYSASATGGNGFARDFLAGVAAMYASVRITLPVGLINPLLTVLATIREHRRRTSSRICEHGACVLGCACHDTDIHLLLERTHYPTAVQVCDEFGPRQEAEV